ncbi:MAG: hypothetical protein A3F67_09985 [Verrucomicrobia bacterium RIFCSPHIGHO2_12_FULL_41_10]|nr:MAG: hypothetical protein A3F67_09985 [Verrucomicrobia bacterium RIFCSPHIGHO2_12_FULL_41_10]HLB32970.1 hypothetical protein [Chthoniobacterales bacterium]
MKFFSIFTSPIIALSLLNTPALVAKNNIRTTTPETLDQPSVLTNQYCTYSNVSSYGIPNNNRDELENGLPQSSDCRDVDEISFQPQLQMDPLSVEAGLETGFTALKKELGVVVKTSSQQAIPLNRTIDAQSDHFIQSVPPQEVNSERLRNNASAIPVLRLRGGGPKTKPSKTLEGLKSAGESDDEDDLDLESERVSDYLNKEICDNIYAACLAKVAALTLEARNTAQGTLNIVQEEAQEWAIAEKIAITDKEKAMRDLQKAKETTEEARKVAVAAEQAVKAAQNTASKADKTNAAMARDHLTYEKNHEAYAMSNLQAKELAEKLTEAKVDTAFAVLKAIQVRNSKHSTAAEAELMAAKEAEAYAEERAFAAANIAKEKASFTTTTIQITEEASRQAVAASKAEMEKLRIETANAVAAIQAKEETVRIAEEKSRAAELAKSKTEVASKAELERLRIETANAVAAIQDKEEAVRIAEEKSRAAELAKSKTEAASKAELEKLRQELETMKVEKIKNEEARSKAEEQARKQNFSIEGVSIISSIPTIKASQTEKINIPDAKEKNLILEAAKQEAHQKLAPLWKKIAQETDLLETQKQQIQKQQQQIQKQQMQIDWKRDLNNRYFEYHKNGDEAYKKINCFGKCFFRNSLGPINIVEKSPDCCDWIFLGMITITPPVNVFWVPCYACTHPCVCFYPCCSLWHSRLNSADAEKDRSDRSINLRASSRNLMDRSFCLESKPETLAKLKATITESTPWMVKASEAKKAGRLQEAHLWQSVVEQSEKAITLYQNHIEKHNTLSRNELISESTKITTSAEYALALAKVMAEKIECRIKEGEAREDGRIEEANLWQKVAVELVKSLQVYQLLAEGSVGQGEIQNKTNYASSIACLAKAMAIKIDWLTKESDTRSAGMVEEANLWQQAIQTAEQAIEKYKAASEGKTSRDSAEIVLGRAKTIAAITTQIVEWIVKENEAKRNFARIEEATLWQQALQEAKQAVQQYQQCADHDSNSDLKRAADTTAADTTFTRAKATANQAMELQKLFL